MAESPTKQVADGCATEVPSSKVPTDYCAHSRAAHDMDGCRVAICPCKAYKAPPPRKE